jgi:hypothetical protein
MRPPRSSDGCAVSHLKWKKWSKHPSNFIILLMSALSTIFSIIKLVRSSIDWRRPGDEFTLHNYDWWATLLVSVLCSLGEVSCPSRKKAASVPAPAAHTTGTVGGC